MKAHSEQEPMATTVGFRFRRLWIVPVAAVLCLAVVAVVLLRAERRNNEWQIADELVEQVNSLGASLEPGAVGTMVVPQSDADELMFLPAYCYRDTLTEYFPNRPKAFIDKLILLSGNDGTCPAFIFLRDGEILSINPAEFTVGVNFALRSWNLNDVREIKIVKETQSPSNFLSLSFLEDDPKK